MSTFVLSPRAPPLRVRWPTGRSAKASSSAGSGSRSACAGCSQNASPEQRDALESGCDRLVSLDAMGRLFKVLALTAGAARYRPASRSRATAMRLESRALGGRAGVRHGFFGRLGGVSEGVWDSLNVGLRSGDRPERIAANRARAAEALGVAPGGLVTARQVHGTTALAVASLGTTRGSRSRRTRDRSAGPAPGRARRRLRPGPAGGPGSGRDRRGACWLEGCPLRRAGGVIAAMVGLGAALAGSPRCWAPASRSPPTRLAPSSWRASPPRTPTTCALLCPSGERARSTSRAISGRR